MNLKRNPDIFALAVLLALLAFVIPGDLNIVRAQRASVRLDLPTPPPPPVLRIPPVNVTDSCGPEMI